MIGRHGPIGTSAGRSQGGGRRNGGGGGGRSSTAGAGDPVVPRSASARGTSPLPQPTTAPPKAHAITAVESSRRGRAESAIVTLATDQHRHCARPAFP